MAATSNPSSITINEDFTAPSFAIETNTATSFFTRKDTAEAKKIAHYIPLCKAIQRGDWEKAQEFFSMDKNALTDKLDGNGNRTIHVAIGNPENIGFLVKLLDEIGPESLPRLVNDKEQNALHYAATIGNSEAAKKLVEKNPDLLFFGDIEKYLPIDRATMNCHKPTLQYLIQMCKQHIELSEKEGCHNPFKGALGVFLLGETILAGYLDIAFDLLKDYPELATTKVPEGSPLWCLASVNDAYPSAKRYNFYQRFIYYHVPMDTTHKISDIENQEGYGANHVTTSYASQGNLPRSLRRAIKRIYAKLWNVTLLHVPHIKRLHEDKEKHNNALKILEFICEKLGKLKYDPNEHFGEAFITAVNNDTVEIIEQIIKTFPQSVWMVDGKGRSFQQLAIMNRCEHVYNFLVHYVTYDKHLHKTLVDNKNNSLLHFAGHLAPKAKLSLVTGAALQMQRELQWFQEVSKFVHPRNKEIKNKDDDTPIMVFRTEHEELRQKGEEWIKKTADSCTITAALIITIAFAAAITVPGGNNENTGRAIYESRPSFIIFVTSNVISLFTSTTSLLLFLSILTARYAEEDFLYRLPKRLIFGLLMLFISVTAMMIAFSATLFIMSGHGKSWIVFPIAALTCLPSASFLTLQLPLLVDLISSTYSNGIFGKESELRITS